MGHGSRGDGKGGNKSLPPMNFTTPDTLMRPALNCFVRRQMGAERSIVITQHRPATPKALSVNKQSRFRAAAACSHQVSSELSDIYSYLTRLYMGDRSSDRNIGGSVLFFCGRPPPKKKKNSEKNGAEGELVGPFCSLFYSVQLLSLLCIIVTPNYTSNMAAWFYARFDDVISSHVLQVGE